MQSFLARLAALALLGAGFAVTGDLRRLVDRGVRFLGTTTVPEGGADAEAPGPPAAAPGAVAREPAEAGLAPADPYDAPLGRPFTPQRLPTSSLDAVDVGTLTPGARLVVWVGSTPSPVVFDVVDPRSGEVLEQSVSLPGEGPQRISRRLRLEGAADRPTRIDRGGPLRLIPLGVAHGGHSAGPAELLGPVRAIEMP